MGFEQIPTGPTPKEKSFEEAFEEKVKIIEDLDMGEERLKEIDEKRRKLDEQYEKTNDQSEKDKIEKEHEQLSKQAKKIDEKISGVEKESEGKEENKKGEDKEKKTNGKEKKSDEEEKGKGKLEKEYEYEWEKQIDSWMEGKIKREMERLKTKDKGIAEQNVREKIRKVLPRVFRSFAVHGMAHKGGEEYTDLDGKTCLGLMKLAGWNIKASGKDKNVSFVGFNERLEGVVHLDVGQYNGVTFLEKIDGGLKELRLSDKESLEERKKDKNFFFNLGVIVDHHPEGAPSSAGVLSKLLNRLGLFKETDPKDMVNIKEMIKFVDLIDSQGFQEIGKPENWNQSDRTILGLHRFLNFSNLWKFFKEKGDFYKPLTDAQLRKYGLIYEKGDGKTVNYQERQRKIINDSDEKLKEFEKNQFIIDTNFGKMVIDVKGELVGGATAAQSIGAGYLKWDAEHKTFFMFSNQELDENLFDNGIRVRKRLWLTPKDKKDAGLNLGKIINKIKGKIIPDSELEKYLRSEKKEEAKEEPKEEEKEKENLEKEITEKYSDELKKIKDMPNKAEGFNETAKLQMKKAEKCFQLIESWKDSAYLDNYKGIKEVVSELDKLKPSISFYYNIKKTQAVNKIGLTMALNYKEWDLEDKKKLKIIKNFVNGKLEKKENVFYSKDKTLKGIAKILALKDVPYKNNIDVIVKEIKNPNIKAETIAEMMDIEKDSINSIKKKEQSLKTLKEDMKHDKLPPEKIIIEQLEKFGIDPKVASKILSKLVNTLENPEIQKEFEELRNTEEFQKLINTIEKVTKEKGEIPKAVADAKEHIEKKESAGGTVLGAASWFVTLILMFFIGLLMKGEDWLFGQAVGGKKKEKK